jgi:glycine C-acetyltransferase
MTDEGFDVVPGTHPIVPVMIGEERSAARFAAALLEYGVYAVSFSYPVVPRGSARIRTQMSSAHGADDLGKAVEAFRAARKAVAI